MFLLQSSASIGLDITNASAANVAIVFGSIMIMFFVLVFVVIKRINKIGPGGIELAKDKDKIDSAVYGMNKENDKIDGELIAKVSEITTSLETRLQNIFYESKMCPATVIALTGSTLKPLYDSAKNNHFTTVMQPENRGEYLDKLLKAIEDRYKATYTAMLNFECGGKFGLMPTWDCINNDEVSIKDKLQNFLKEWVYDVVTETIKSCVKKIKNYKDYQDAAFKNNKRWSDIMAECITKNERYISLLDRHGKGWK